MIYSLLTIYPYYLFEIYKIKYFVFLEFKNLLYK